jgi:hypothetical protein
MEKLQSESGNVLFLILIAVALFSALSYAMTQSSRSGSGEATGEKSLISAAEITQYPASVRTDILRMMIDNNIPVNQLEFNAPSDFATLTLNSAGQATAGVFHPQGGGATYQLADAAVSASGVQQQWYFNADWSVPLIGTSTTANSSGNEVTAFLPNLNEPVCQKIDDQLGITSNPLPVVAYPVTAFEKTQGTGPESWYELFTAAPYGTQCIDTVACGASGGKLADQPFGCFQTNDATPVYVYYHVLLEN